MKVTVYKTHAIVFNEYAEVAKLEGDAFFLLLRKYAERKGKSKGKSDGRILSEVVEAFDSDIFTWIPISEANK